VIVLAALAMTAAVGDATAAANVPLSSAGAAASQETSVRRGEVHAPTVWDRAADPVRDGWEHVHRSVGRLRREVDEIESRGPAAVGVQERLTLALHLLELAGAAEASDIRLRYDMGLILSKLEEDERGVTVLENALREAPEHPMAADAYFHLAICYARLGRSVDEIAAWGKYLELGTDPGVRALVLSNRAEAHMIEGNMPIAIEDYRASLALDPSNVAAHWGLAVALDRTGDQAGGLSEAKIAIGYDPVDRELSRSFFVPPYERHWYEGLGATARAEMIEDATTSILWWETAVAKWSEYVGAAAEGDRWLPLAKLHLMRCERELASAKKKGKKRGGRPED
jgi:tetratricopeptide (TPR) repeat protein